MGDCFCIAIAIQKIIDPEIKGTGIVCIRKSASRRGIAHCMVRNLNNGYFYDANGAHDPEEVREMLNDFDVDPDCFPNESGDFEDEWCFDEYSYKNERRWPREFSCGKKVQISEKIIRENMPDWLKKARSSINKRPNFLDI
jgi:hypothetical protein